MIINLGRMLPHASSDLPETTRAALWSLFSLASDGVYTAISVTRDAVVSYTAFSPLPLRAVIFCCTFPGVASAGRYPASCPVKPGLSSIFHAIIRPTHVFCLSCSQRDGMYVHLSPDRYNAYIPLSNREYRTPDKFTNQRIVRKVILAYCKEVLKEFKQTLCLKIFRIILLY